MPIYKGANQITKVYQGEQEIDKVYRGASKVYGADKGTEITVSGNPLMLTNVAKESPLDTLEIMGRTEQTQLQGYNLLNSAYYQNGFRENTEQKRWAEVIVTENLLKTFLKEGETYTFSFDVEITKLAKYDNKWQYIVGFLLYCDVDGTKNRIFYALANLESDRFIGHKKHSSFTFTCPNLDNCKLLCYTNRLVETAGVVNPSDYDTVIFSNMQLEKGSVAHDYEPYCGGIPSPSPDYPQEINNVESVEVVQSGKNLWNTDNEFVGWINTANNIVASDGRIIRLPCKEGDAFTLSAKYGATNASNIIVISYRDENDVGLLRTVANANLELTVSATAPKNATSVCFARYYTVPIEIQIEQGTEATPYEPYKPIHTATIDGIELTKWDKIVKRNGVWGVSKKHYEHTVNRVSVFYTTSNPNGNICYFSPPNYNKATFAVRNFLCDKFMVTAESLDKMPLYSICGQSGASSTCWICLPKDVTSAIEANQYLANNPAKLIYPTVAEQSFIPLSQTTQDQLNALQIYKPTTIVSNNAECEMSATYLCYLDSAEAMLSAMYQNDLSEVLK